MALGDRGFSILAAPAAAAFALVAVVAGPAQAQPLSIEERLREVQAIDRLFSEVESARLNSKCALRDDKLTETLRRLQLAEQRGMFLPDALDAYAGRLRDAQARPCPPIAPPAPPPPVSVTGPQPAPAPDPALVAQAERDRLAAAMEIAATTCNQTAWEGARAALIELIERQLETETDFQQRLRLNNAKNALRRQTFPRCQFDPKRNERAVILNFLYGPFFIGSIGSGVVRPGAPGTPERYAHESDDRLTGFTIDGGLEFGEGWTAAAGYQHGQGYADFTTAPGPNFFTGIVFGDLSPAGTSGYIADFGSNGYSEVLFDALWGELMYDFFGVGYDDEDEPDWDDDEDEPRVGDFRLRVSGFVRYEYDWKSHTSSIESQGSGIFAPFSFSQMRDQEINQSNFAAGLEFRTEVPIAAALSAGLRARAGGYYYKADLDSLERNQASFGPAQTRDFDIAISDDDDGFGFLGSLEGRLDYEIDNVILSAIARFDYRSEDASVRNPKSGDEVFFDGIRIELSSEDRQAVFFGLGLSASF